MGIKKEDFSVVILAAGKATRMEQGVNKNYIEVLGHPAVYYSIKAFKDYASEIIIVTDKAHFDDAKKICSEFSYDKIKVVEGGQERYDSVRAGLKEVSCDYVFIHDGARILVTDDIIERCAIDAYKYDACIAAMPSKDTIKISRRAIVSDEEPVVSNTPGRTNLWQAQTPQTFKTELIQEAYEKVYKSKTIAALTDDSQTVEQMGRNVYLVRGSYTNIKITEPSDLEFAKIILSQRN